MANKVVTELTAKDELSRAISGIEGMLSGFGSRLTGVFVGVGAAIGAALSVREIVSFASESVKAASDAADAMAKFEAISRASGNTTGMTKERLSELASQMQLLTKYEDDNVVQAASLLVIYENLNGDVFERTLKMSADLAELFGGDLSSAARMLGRALNDPANASRLLRTVGVQLTGEVEEQIKKFKEMGDIASAQKLIFEQLETRIGGLAVAMGDTLSGRAAKLSNQFGDIKEQVGGALLPVLEKLVPTAEAIGVAFETWLNDINSFDLSGFEALEKMLMDLIVTITEFGTTWHGTMSQTAADALKVIGNVQDPDDPWRQMTPEEVQIMKKEQRVAKLRHDIESGLSRTGASWMRTAGYEERSAEIRKLEKEIEDLKKPKAEEDKSWLEVTIETLEAEADQAAEKIAQSQQRVRDALEKRRKDRDDLRKKDTDDAKRPDDGSEFYEKMFGEEGALGPGPDYKARAKEDERINKMIERARKDFDERQIYDSGPTTQSKKDGFTASIEGLADVNRRITAAAASRGESPEDKIIKVNRETTKQVLEKLDKAIEVFTPVAPALDALPRGIADAVETGLA